jgi:hypothetical protein
MYRFVYSLRLLLWWLAVAMPLGAYAGDDTRCEIVEVLTISEDISISSNHISNGVRDLATLDNGLFRSQVAFDIISAFSTWRHPYSSDRIQTSGDIAVRFILSKGFYYDASPQASIRDASKATFNSFVQGDVGTELLKLTPPLFNGDQGKQFLFRQDFEQDYNTLMRILDDGIPGGKVAAWEAFLPDQAIRKNTTWLQKLDDYLAVKPNKLEEVTDQFAIENGKNRVTAYLIGLLERKHFDGTVYRGDLANVTPAQAFSNGIPPKGSHDNLIKHLDGGSVNKGDFVSTSKDIAIANDFASNNGYVFKVRSRNSKGIDVNETLGDEVDNWFPEQFEVSIIGGIDKSDIIGAYPKGQLTQADFIPNPNYVP